MRSSDGTRGSFDGISMDRVNSFSDAVFAVAITLLVLNIKAPVIPKAMVDQELPRKLLALWPHYQAYIISFVVIGAFWINHHQFFARLKSHDTRILWINLFYLMCVVFIPFPTYILSEYAQSRAAVALYAGTIGTCGLLFAVLVLYVLEKEKKLKHAERVRELKIDLVFLMSMVAVFFVSIGVTYINVPAAMYFWLSIIPIDFFIRHLLKRRYRRAGGLS